MLAATCPLELAAGSFQTPCEHHLPSRLALNIRVVHQELLVLRVLIQNLVTHPYIHIRNAPGVLVVFS